AKTAGQIKHVDLAELDSVAVEHGAQACDVGPFGLGELVYVAFQEINVVRLVDCDSIEPVVKAAHPVHRLAAQQLAHQVHQTRAADPFGGNVADNAQMKRAVAVERDVFNRADEAGHAAGNSSALERWAGRAGSGQNAMLVADN